MDGLRTSAEKLQRDVQSAFEKMEIARLSAELTELRDKSLQTDFWNDNFSAQEIMKQISRLESRTKPWLELKEVLGDTLDLIKTDDKSLDGWN